MTKYVYGWGKTKHLPGTDQASKVALCGAPVGNDYAERAHGAHMPVCRHCLRRAARSNSDIVMELAEKLRALGDTARAAGLRLAGWDDGCVYIEGGEQNRTQIKYDPSTGQVTYVTPRDA